MKEKEFIRALELRNSIENLENKISALENEEIKISSDPNNNLIITIGGSPANILNKELLSDISIKNINSKYIEFINFVVDKFEEHKNFKEKEFDDL